MKSETWIFGINAVFFGLVAPAYWFLSYDPTGTAALIMTALLATLVAFYLGFHASKMEPRPEDRKEAEIADGAGELGFFPPYSWWPLWCARPWRSWCSASCSAGGCSSSAPGWAPSRSVAGSSSTTSGSTRTDPLVTGATVSSIRCTPQPLLPWCGNAYSRGVSMSVRHAYLSRALARRSTVAVACIVALSAAVAGCTATAGEDVPSASDQASSPAPSSSAPPVSEASISSNIADRAKDVRVDETVTLTAENGTFDEVTVAIGRGKKNLEGELSSDRATWTSTQALEPGLRYTVDAVAVDAEGLEAESTTQFRTERLTLDDQTFPSIAPLNGETVGVGMPVIVQFDVPVADHEAFEKHLSVESTPKQVGSWHWVNDNEVHWRPKTYWQPGTDVTVHADINSVHAGNGVFGQMDRTTSFQVGDSIVSRVDIPSHTMKVFINGDLARSMPVSAGKPGFITRSGTKVIIEKVRHKTMDAATIGISKDDPEYYNLEVEYAMRVTYSGEFLHAAPWSAGLAGCRERQPRLRGHEHGERRLAVRPHQAR